MCIRRDNRLLNARAVNQLRVNRTFKQELRLFGVSLSLL